MLKKEFITYLQIKAIKYLLKLTSKKIPFLSKKVFPAIISSINKICRTVTQVAINTDPHNPHITHYKNNYSNSCHIQSLKDFEDSQKSKNFIFKSYFDYSIGEFIRSHKQLRELEKSTGRVYVTLDEYKRVQDKTIRFKNEKMVRFLTERFEKEIGYKNERK